MFLFSCLSLLRSIYSYLCPSPADFKRMMLVLAKVVDQVDGLRRNVRELTETVSRSGGPSTPRLRRLADLADFSQLEAELGQQPALRASMVSIYFRARSCTGLLHSTLYKFHAQAQISCLFLDIARQ